MPDNYERMSLNDEHAFLCAWHILNRAKNRETDHALMVANREQIVKLNQLTWNMRAERPLPLANFREAAQVARHLAEVFAAKDWSFCLRELARIFDGVVQRSVAQGGVDAPTGRV
jgi:hypothetical protein